MLRPGPTTSRRPDRERGYVVSDENAVGNGEGATPVEMTTPWRRDLGEVGERLAAWARAQVAPDAVVSSGEVSA